MEASEVKGILDSAFVGADVTVEKDGSHYLIQIVHDSFAGMMPVKKQQAVYACLSEHIASGAMHAVHIKAYTPEQYKKLSS